MSQPRYLTKSRFKLGSECPTKLFYTGKKEVYADQKLGDTFLQSLADGGFQVGHLAKHYFPGGVEIERAVSGDYDVPVRQTRELIESGDVTIYEAAFQVESFFIYADIVVRKGDIIELYEVKAKSYDPAADEFLTKRGSTLASGWVSYLEDVAFQKMVIRKAFPQFQVKAFLTMANKASRCATDGLNQKFRVKRSEQSSYVIVSEQLSAEDLAAPILINVDVDAVCDKIFDGSAYADAGALSFEGRAYALAGSYVRDERVPTAPSRTCKKCEFVTKPEDATLGLKSGYRECWAEALGWQNDKLDMPTSLSIWNLHYKRSDKLLAEKRVCILDVTEDDISPVDDAHPGLSSSRRQWMQVVKAQNNDREFHLDRECLKKEMDTWVFPLHFIDFETSMPAIPFTKGRRPYEGIAFQFSHHVLCENGTVEHKGEFLNALPGVFPSFEFVRELKAQLETDNGTIFRYADHENTYLNMIMEQMLDSGEGIEDRDELCGFIRQISRRRIGSKEYDEGPRNMVDMLRLVKRYYFDPVTGGSNSIKQILPAVINRSRFLKEKYSKPVYGAPDGIRSKNYSAWQWVKLDETGTAADPYNILPKMFSDVSPEDFSILMSDTDELKDGGAALTAYAKLQFQEMSDYERSEIESALLKYCELDSLAMVMIYEGWRDLINAA